MNDFIGPLIYVYTAWINARLRGAEKCPLDVTEECAVERNSGNGEHLRHAIHH